MLSRNLGPGDSLRGDVWPPEMTLTVEDNDPGLLALLWARDAWNISPGNHAPPPLVDPPEQLGNADPECAASWHTAWLARIEFLAQGPDPLAFQRFQISAHGSAERDKALQALRGPIWEDQPNHLRNDDAFWEWQNRHILQTSEKNSTPLPETPERMTQVSLVPSWKAGLRRIITIPCQGEYTQILGPTALLVTDHTRSDPKQYSEAQEQFRHVYGKPGPGWAA